MVCNMISKKIEILIRHLFTFSTIVLNMMKLLVIVFVIKLFAQISLIKKNYSYFSSYVSITLQEITFSLKLLDLLLK